MYIFSSRIIHKMHMKSTSSRNEAMLRHKKIKVRVIAFSFIILALTLCWRTYTLGFYDTNDFVSHIFVNNIFVIIKLELFAVVAFWTLEIHLTTLVLKNGDETIVGLDKFDREVFRFYLNRERKKSEDFFSFTSNHHKNSNGK